MNTEVIICISTHFKSQELVSKLSKFHVCRSNSREIAMEKKNQIQFLLALPDNIQPFFGSLWFNYLYNALRKYLLWGNDTDNDKGTNTYIIYCITDTIIYPLRLLMMCKGGLIQGRLKRSSLLNLRKFFSFAPSSKRCAKSLCWMSFL